MPNFLFESFFSNKICSLLNDKGFVLFNTMILDEAHNIRNRKYISDIHPELYSTKMLPRIENHNELIKIKDEYKMNNLILKNENKRLLDDINNKNGALLENLSLENEKSKEKIEDLENSIQNYEKKLRDLTNHIQDLNEKNETNQNRIKLENEQKTSSLNQKIKEPEKVE